MYMNTQEIYRTLATEVMGWSAKESFWDEEVGQVRWNVDKEAYVVWSPITNIADAWMLLQKIKDSDYLLAFETLLEKANFTILNMDSAVITLLAFGAVAGKTVEEVFYLTEFFQ